MNFFEEKIKSNRVYSGKILNLDVDDVCLPDGSFSKREIIRHSGGAAALFVKDSKVLLVRQFRYAYQEEIYEIPAGKLNVGEDPAVAAARELKEETGYRAELVPLLKIYPTPGYSDEIIHIYLAKNAEYTVQKLDEGEFLDVEFIHIAQVLEMIEGGIIRDAKTVSAIYAYLYNNK